MHSVTDENARRFRTPADYQALNHRFSGYSRDHPVVAVRLALRQLKLKARSRSCNWDKLRQLQAPLIAQDVDGRFFLLAALDDDRAVIQRPTEQAVTELHADAFRAGSAGEGVIGFSAVGHRPTIATELP